LRPAHWLAFLCALVVAGFPMPADHAAASGDHLTAASLLPQWIPQAQFAGYMMALEKGFYADEGIELTLMTGGPGNPPFEGVAQGRATFCTGWLVTGMQRRAEGIPLINVAQMIQRSALILIARKDSGIETPKDLKDKRVSLWGEDFSIQPAAFFRKFGITPHVIPQYVSLDLFFRGAVEAASAMWYNEYIELLHGGFAAQELTLFHFSDYGLNFPEDGIYCLQDTFDADPDLCRAFVRASVKGWLYAFDHKDESVSVVLKHCRKARVRTNRIHQRNMLERMEDLIAPKGDRASMGMLKQKEYESVGRILVKLDVLDAVPPYADFYRGERQP
jgi:NitT/TauT family transport system substrate-binding protein